MICTPSVLHHNLDAVRPRTGVPRTVRAEIAMHPTRFRRTLVRLTKHAAGSHLPIRTALLHALMRRAMLQARRLAVAVLPRAEMQPAEPPQPPVVAVVAVARAARPSARPVPLAEAHRVAASRVGAGHLDCARRLGAAVRRAQAVRWSTRRCAICDGAEMRCTE